MGEGGSTFTGLSGKSKDDFGHGNAKYVTYLNVLQNPVGSITQLDNIEIDEKQNAVKQGDVFFTTSSETPDEVGMSSVWKYDIPNIYLNSFTFGYRPNQEFDLDYLAYMLRSDSVRQKIKLLAQGISRFNISKTKMMEISIPIASDKEQTEIGKLFANVEALLSLHQRKLDNVKMLKKSLLQKLFPKDGEKIPELRFPGFTDDWEQRKLGDVAKRVRGNDGRMSLPTLTISAGSGWLDQRERFSGNIAGNEQKNYTLLRKGELSYNHGNSKLAKYGAVYRLTSHEEALVPRVYHSFRTVNGGNPEFIEYLFATKKPDKELGKLISSGARMDGLLNINYEDFMGIRIDIPLSQEQESIGNFFVQIDAHIALHQRKLDHLKELKKGLLQQMFV